MFQDFKELLAAFNEHKVKYLIIGGYAVGFHAEPRATKDLDILIGDTQENAESAYASLQEYGAPVKSIKPADLIDKDAFFRMGTPPLMIDILSTAAGVDFEAAWSRRQKMTLDHESGLTAWVISCEDLIASKIAAGRPQDLVDATVLRTSGDTVAPKTVKDFKPKN